MLKIMHRVFFDTNAGNNRVGYLLWFDRSVTDLEAMGHALVDGAEVVLYMLGELEIPAKLTFDSNTGHWRGFLLDAVQSE